MTTTTDTRVGPAKGSQIDIYPTKVETPQWGWLPKSRARVTTDGHLQVWVENEQWAHQPLLVIDEEIDTIIANSMGNNTVPYRKQQLVVMTMNRNIFTVKRANGCGCGSKLKNTRQLPTVKADDYRPRPVGERQLSDIDMVLTSHFPKMANK